MQIMKLGKLFKNILWILSAYNTINTLPDAVIYVSNTGKLRNYNKKASQIFELDQSSQTLNINDIIVNGFTQLKLSVNTSKPVLSTATVTGKQFYIELNAVKKTFGYSVTVRDLTKLTSEIINDEKTQLFNNEKNAMLAKLESDIKSPITSISGFSKGLLDGLGGELSEKQAKYVKIIQNNSEELYHFMDKLLEFSKVESSIYESDFHNFDVVEALKSVAKEFEAELVDKKLGFDIDYDNLEKRNIYSDVNAVKNAFRNILKTSISMTETGFILVKLLHPTPETSAKYNLDINKKETSYLDIVIKDTGIGVPEEEMKYLCEPYAQLEKGKKNFLRALKLGTASILIKRANGLINICSEVKVGTKFEIILPIEKDQDE